MKRDNERNPKLALTNMLSDVASASFCKVPRSIVAFLKYQDISDALLKKTEEILLPYCRRYRRVRCNAIVFNSTEYNSINQNQERDVTVCSHSTIPAGSNFLWENAAIFPGIVA